MYKKIQKKYYRERFRKVLHKWRGHSEEELLSPIWIWYIKYIIVVNWSKRIELNLKAIKHISGTILTHCCFTCFKAFLDVFSTKMVTKRVILVNMVISVILGHEKTKIQNILDLGKIDVFSVRTNIYIKNK